MAAAAVARGRFVEYRIEPGDGNGSDADDLDMTPPHHHRNLSPLPKFAKTQVADLRHSAISPPPSPVQRQLGHYRRQSNPSWTVTHPILSWNYSEHLRFDEMLLEWFSPTECTDTEATQVVISFRWGHCVASALGEFRPVRHLDESGVERIGRINLNVSRQDQYTPQPFDELQDDIAIAVHQYRTPASSSRRLQYHKPVRLCDMRYIVTDLLLRHPGCSMAIFTWLRKVQRTAWRRRGLLRQADICEGQPYGSQLETAAWLYYGGITTRDYWRDLRKDASIKAIKIFV